MNLTHELKNIVTKIKGFQPKAVWVVADHGTEICAKSMVLIDQLARDIDIKKQNLHHYVDYYLKTSAYGLNKSVQAGLEAKKAILIGSPRYCPEWLDIKKKRNLDGAIPPMRKGCRAKILFLIPKKQINTFTDEVVRTIDFISQYNEIDLIINRAARSYPKISSETLNRKNCFDCLISDDYSTSALIHWADIVIHAGTGVIFESFVANKITVLLSYLTCNTLISDEYNAGLNLRTRDDLRNLCNLAVKSVVELKETYVNDHGEQNKKFVADFVCARKNTVPSNVANAFDEICGKFC